jgi:hypothetical protein
MAWGPWLVCPWEFWEVWKEPPPTAGPRQNPSLKRVGVDPGAAILRRTSTTPSPYNGQRWETRNL